MKKLVTIFAITILIFLSSCSTNESTPGPAGQNGKDGLLSEVFEIKNINFNYNPNTGYTIYRNLSPNIFAADNILIYRLTGTINSSTPIWQLIPRTLYLPQGQLDYDFDFSKQDFTIYAGGNYNLSLTPAYLNNQTFRIVILPGYFSNKSAANVNFENYDEVLNYFKIDKDNVKILL